MLSNAKSRPKIGTEKKLWVWMPHAAHFICGNECQFHLATWVGEFIVSTVGELWPNEVVRRIHAEIHDPAWYKKNKELKGDYFDAAYMKRFGYNEIGCGRKFETYVFKAKKSTSKECDCCQYVPSNWAEIDSEGYNDSKLAFEGHMRMCEKWSKKGDKK